MLEPAVIVAVGVGGGCTVGIASDVGAATLGGTVAAEGGVGVDTAGADAGAEPLHATTKEASSKVPRDRIIELDPLMRSGPQILHGTLRLSARAARSPFLHKLVGELLATASARAAVGSISVQVLRITAGMWLNKSWYAGSPLPVVGLDSSHVS